MGPPASSTTLIDFDLDIVDHASDYQLFLCIRNGIFQLPVDFHAPFVSFLLRGGNTLLPAPLIVVPIDGKERCTLVKFLENKCPDVIRADSPPFALAS